MNAFVKFLFPVSAPSESRYSWLMLFTRIIFGLLLMRHGIDKIMHFATLSTSFPDPLYIGHEASLLLAIFAEVVCSAAVIIGFLYRLALLPMIFVMFIIVLDIGQHTSFSSNELPIAYGFVYLLMYWADAGRYSVDGWIGYKIANSKR